MNIILLAGPKHSGKTSVGRALADRVSGGFVDLDGHIQAQTGKNPRALYREGPGIFMNAEAEALGDLLNRGEGRDGGPQIIAAGGGLIDNPPALALLEKAGALTRVYLEVPANTAWERISAGAEKNGLPPFLDTQNPRETHRALHERRAAAYRKWARFTINGEGKTPEEIAGEIVGLL